ncbi:SCO family protein [Skermanella mucosa]|uniref:SCO family protein n=1 Tax=Skermanella mucosa TaxID=1789672 RepID=UPI001E5D35A6|nr:SCO family protein [Skermanella mucosa]UEM24166.1 SCO family protein [Skermanella mucosa]
MSKREQAHRRRRGNTRFPRYGRSCSGALAGGGRAWPSSRDKYVEIVKRPAPNFRLADTEGRIVSLDDLKGRAVVLWFIYNRRLDECFLYIEAIANIQLDISTTPMRERVRFVAITTGLERDTAAVLREYGPAHGLDPESAMMLTSGPEAPTAIWELARQYGLKFIQTPDWMQMHGLIMHLSDREGNLRACYHGLEFNPKSKILHINAFTNDRLIKAHYEFGDGQPPESRRYGTASSPCRNPHRYDPTLQEKQQ